MRDKGIKTLVMAALFAALICAATMVVAIPLPASGYANLGDCVVILAGCLLGPLWGAAAAGIGSALADVLVGFAVYAPATFIIKALMAMAAYAVFTALSKNESHILLAAIIMVVTAEIIMIGGYFLYDWLILDQTAAIIGVWGNFVQATVSAVAAAFLLILMQKTPGIKKKLV